jgi:hypothetical protein
MIELIQQKLIYTREKTQGLVHYTGDVAEEIRCSQSLLESAKRKNEKRTVTEFYTQNSRKIKMKTSAFPQLHFHCWCRDSDHTKK